MTKIKIDVPEVRDAAGRLSDLAEPLSSVGSGLNGCDGMLTSDAASGFSDFSAAYSAALGVLGEDATYTAGWATQAADEYARVNARLAGN